MMTTAIVDSTSVEALAFDYFSFGLYVVVNNLWTLVAVATAAFSFWRFKLAPSLSRHLVHVFSPEIAAESSSPSVTRPNVDNLTVIPPPMVAECSDDGAVAGKRVFSRFQCDDVVDEEEGLVDEEESELVVKSVKTVRFDVLERLRLLDLGIYEHQDMGVLDGNVVKLWDSCRVGLSPRATLRASIVSPAVLGGGKCSTRLLHIHL